MNRLRQIGLRLTLAIGLSFALWAFVSFSENPEERLSFDSMTLEVEDLASDLVIVDQAGLPNASLPQIEVTIETSRSQASRLRALDLRTFVDLGGLGAGDHAVPVQVEEAVPGIQVSFPDDSVDPNSVQIRLEQVITRTVPISLSIQGNVPFSFELGAPTVQLNGTTADTIAISGPQSRVERVVAAQAIVNVNQLRASYASPVQLTAIASDEEPVEGVKLAAEAVDVNIPITPVAGVKLVPVQPNIQGLPAEGYAIASIQVDPALVTLTGSSGPLDAIDEITTAPVDISGASSSISQSVAINFPPATSLRAGEPTTAIVQIAVVPLTLTFQTQIPAQIALVGVRDDLRATTEPVLLALIVNGSNNALNQLQTQPATATVDVTGFGPGSYVLVPRIALPDGIILTGTVPSVTVTLILPTTPTLPSIAVPSPTPQATSTTEDPLLEPTTEAPPNESPTTERSDPGASGTAEPTPSLAPTEMLSLTVNPGESTEATPEPTPTTTVLPAPDATPSQSTLPPTPPTAPTASPAVLSGQREYRSFHNAHAHCRWALSDRVKGVSWRCNYFDQPKSG